MLSVLLKQLYRRPKYPLAIGIGIMLAVSMIVGTSIAVDNVAKTVFKSKLNEIPVDFMLDKYIENPHWLPQADKLKNQLFKVPEIKSIEIAWHFRIPNHILSREPYKGNETDFTALLANITDDDIISFMLLGVPPDFGENTSGLTWVSGNIDTTKNNSIAISEAFASSYNLSIGDIIYLTALYRVFNVSTLNYTFVIQSLKLQITGIYKFNSVFDTLFHALEQNDLIFLTSFANAYNIRTKLSAGYVNNIEKQEDTNVARQIRTKYGPFPAGTYTYRIYVFLDRDTLYNVWNMNDVNEKIQKIRNAIFVQLFMDAHYDIRFVASGLVEDLANWSDRIKIKLSVFYIPIIIIGVFLSTAVSYAVIENRKRELNLLVVRGADEQQIRINLIIEGAIIGVISSGLGMILASVVGAIISYIVVAKWNIGTLSINLFPVFDVYGIFGFLIGIALVVFSVSLSTRELRTLLPTKEIKKKPTKITKNTSRTVKLLLVGEILSIYKIIAWLVNFSSITLIYNLKNVNFFLMFLVYIFVYLDFMFLGPLAPILFIYCTIKLIFMYIGRVIIKVSTIIRKITRSTLANIAMNNILHNPKRYLKVSIILSLSIGFGVLIPVAHASQVNYQVRLIKVQNAADIKISTIRAAMKREVTSLEHTLNVTGVNNITFLYYANIYSNGRSDAAFAVNPEKYMYVAKDNIAENFSQNGLETSLKKMRENITYALATEGYLQHNHLKVGDVVNVTVSVNSTTTVNFEVKIIDTIYILPGVGLDFFGQRLENKIVLNSELLRVNNVIYTSNFTYAMIYYVFVDTETDEDALNVGKYFRDELGFMEVSITKEKIDALTSDPLTATMYSIIDTEYFLIFFMATVGIGFVLLVEITERKREFAVMLARGTTTRQIFLILFIELAFVTFLAIIMGVITGYISGAGYAASSLRGFFPFGIPTNVYRCLPPKIVVPLTVLYVILGAISSLLLVMVIPIVMLNKINIREVIQSEI